MAFLNHQRPLWALLAAAPLVAAISTQVQAQTWKINLRDADLTAFINEVADITGKNFAVDPRVRGNVTVISNKALNKDEVYDLFLGVLNVNGVVALPSGNTVKLVPDSNAKNSGIPYDARNRAGGDQIVTRVIWLENTNPNDLIPALRPLMPQFAHLAAVAGTNALIVSDRATNIYQLESIIRNLDGTGQNDIEAITLQSSQAEEIIGLLETMSATGTSKDFIGSRVRVIADNRTNRILIKGDPDSRKRLRHTIEMLDVPSADRLGGLKVFRLKYASAKNLAEILQGLVTGQSVSSSSTSNNANKSSSINNLTSNSQGQTGNSSSGVNSSINLNSGFNNNQNNAGITSFNGNGVSIIADGTQNALVVKADPQLMREIEAAIQQLDIRRQQVLIEAAIIEVSGNDADQLGIQWALGDLSSGVGLMSFSNVGASLASIAAGYASAGASGAAAAIAGDASKGNGATFGVGNFENSRKAYGALIQALKTNTKSNFLSTPSIVTMDNEEAYIVVGQNVPFVTGSVSTGTSGTVNPYTTVERKDVGVTLKVVPHIGENGTVRLEVEQEVSDVQNNKGQATDLVTNKRAIKTAVLAEHGQTVVLGGLIADNTALSRQGVPGLSDIPYLGRLFRADSRSNEKRNLLVFIHPTIVGDADDVRRLSQQRYNQLYSLQLAMDNNGNFAKLPENVGDIYQQQPTLNNSPYQKVPTATQSKTVVVTTPVAIDAPPVQKQSIQLPAKATERSKNTVTTTTIRPAYSQ
ncbi:MULTISPECIES: type II secretion system secretin GspD [unclassified Acinetobacter]|uniref:type II secretion system secretin GspD n=1 Tax=unclassified Acinetobacter TaxID=196816 RepID=UPI00244CCA04|nr:MULTISPECIES: type II secretion system secretin GspD [unclassified Acinetobacter]MDH0031663.1 type II secretion system secretin GspD [Acinetobacter sp. GD04021]MDH0887492.1 type II secretion system secretin GspD [Acinetobacter sp. GD03873]MDH1083833.1 type II secretion system secretin GspD [Acinetobacter sp. GD03983]MDH2190808.1 type II secretion system secretin GspD [Acinetobacter sp. GD03645]MDH2204360.1 type II secretion system secretin GspD [Acinetobacter sp. GD03647]